MTTLKIKAVYVIGRSPAIADDAAISVLKLNRIIIVRSNLD
jgi:hypothetical protein